MGFDWQTEEDQTWDVAPVVQATAVPSRRRWPFYVLTLLILASVATVAVYRAVNRRAVEVTTAVESDVLSTHNMVLFAAQEKDGELFASMLSGRDEQWASSYEQLVGLGYLWDRQPLGLTLQEKRVSLTTTATPDETQIVSVDINPTLTRANVVFEQNYLVDLGDPLLQKVTLRQTAVYRLGPNRWLFAPPDSDFWGTTLTAKGEYLTLIYPKRDAQLAERLAVDLDSKIGEMCQLQGVACPTPLRVSVTFATDPASLVNNFVDNAALLQSRRLRVIVPTPTLIGLPTDEIGYEALLRGYATQMVTALLTDFSGYTCCSHEFFHQIQVDHQLAELGLRSWPVKPADYQAIFNNTADLEEVIAQAEPLWNATHHAGQEDPAWPMAYALVEFALTDPARSVADFEPYLDPPVNFTMWVNFALRSNPNLHTEVADLETQWQRFLYERMQTSLSQPPLALPEQTIAMLCQNKLYHYDLIHESVTAVPSTLHIDRMFPLPNDQGVYAYGLRTVNNEPLWQAVFWQNGVERVLYEAPTTEGTLYEGYLDDSARNLMVVASSGTDALHWVDTENCADSCASRVVPAFSVWSPDGSSQFQLNWLTRNRDIGEFQFTPLDRQGNVLGDVGTGNLIVWLDNGRYALVRQVPYSSVQELVVGEVGTYTTHKVLDTAVLRSLLPVSEQGDDLIFNVVRPNPANPSQVVILAVTSVFPAEYKPYYYFWADLDSGKTTLLYQFDKLSSLNPYDVSLSPDGRWLVILQVRQEIGTTSQTVLHLVDTQTGELSEQVLGKLIDVPVANAHIFDWSADGQWFLYKTGKGFMLKGPAIHYERPFIPGLSNCTDIAWVNFSP